VSNVFVRFDPLNSCPAESLCFHSISRCDWFVTSSHDFDENKQLDHQSTIIFISLTDFFHSYFTKAIDHSFYGFTGAINHLGCWENTQKACKSLGSWFTSFSRVLPTSRVVYCTGKPIERVVYCLNNINIVLFLHIKRVCKSFWKESLTRVQTEPHLHNAAHALSSPSQCFQLSRQIFISLTLISVKDKSNVV